MYSKKSQDIVVLIDSIIIHTFNYINFNINFITQVWWFNSRYTEHSFDINITYLTTILYCIVYLTMPQFIFNYLYNSLNSYYSHRKLSFLSYHSNYFFNAGTKRLLPIDSPKPHILNTIEYIAYTIISTILFPISKNTALRQWLWSLSRKEICGLADNNIIEKKNKSLCACIQVLYLYKYIINCSFFCCY